MLILKTKLERSACTKWGKWGCLTDVPKVWYFCFLFYFCNNDIPPLLHCFKWYVHTCIRHCHITYHFIERPAGATFHYMFAYNVWLTLLLLFTNYIQTIYKGHVLNFFLIDLMFLMYIYFCLFLVGFFFSRYVTTVKSNRTYIGSLFVCGIDRFRQLFWFPETSSSFEKQATGPGL